jgi:hypothetical protein
MRIFFWIQCVWVTFFFQSTPSFAQGCLNTTLYPLTNFDPTPNTWVDIDSCNKAGEYANVNVIQGGLYTFSTRQYDGSNVNYDSQLTLRNSSGEVLAYGDDSGPNELQSSLYWLADFTGVVQIHLNQYECASNDSCSKIRVYYDAPVGLSEIGNEMEFTVFPNPTTGEFTIEMPEENVGEALYCRLMNLQGQFISENKLFDASNGITFPKDALTGVYQMLILNANKKIIHTQLLILK